MFKLTEIDENLVNAKVLQTQNRERYQRNQMVQFNIDDTKTNILSNI